MSLPRKHLTLAGYRLRVQILWFFIAAFEFAAIVTAGGDMVLTALPEFVAGELSAPFILGLLATASAPLLAILTAVLGVGRDYIAAESLR